MIKKSLILILRTGLLAISLINSSFSFATSNFISLEQVTKDVTYLASDDLKGRGNFSNEINQAANYIAQRFEESGLTGAKGISAQGFLQKYKITKVSSETLSLVLNSKEIVAENLTIASNIEEISWAMSKRIKNNDFSIHTIGKDDDIRTLISDINSEGGEHLILLHPSHKKIFKRYQQRFSHGVTKLIQNEGHQQRSGTIVIALCETTAKEVNNVNILAVNKRSASELTNVIAIL